MVRLFIILILIALSGCSSTYQIKADKHRSTRKVLGINTPPLAPYLGNPHTFSVEFQLDSSVWHNNKSHDHINKIGGLSWHHHQNNSSFRFGFIPWFGHPYQFCLFGYWYENGGPFQYIEFDHVQAGKMYKAWVDIKKGETTFYLEKGNTVIIPFDPRKGIWWGYKLYPYYGGTKTAPQKMTFKVKTKRY